MRRRIFLRGIMVMLVIGGFAGCSGSRGELDHIMWIEEDEGYLEARDVVEFFQQGCLMGMELYEDDSLGELIVSAGMEVQRISAMVTGSLFGRVYQILWYLKFVG